MNARINSIQSQTGVRGDGEMTFGANPIEVPIPAMLKDPSSHRITTDRSKGIQTDALIVVSREALRRQGHEPTVGDRVAYIQRHLGAVARSGDVVDLRSLEEDTMIELAIKERVDHAVVEGAS